VTFDLALEAQLVCVLWTGLAAAQLAHRAIDALQLKLVEGHGGSEVRDRPLDANGAIANASVRQPLSGRSRRGIVIEGAVPSPVPIAVDVWM
jgi:hypothetical protein